MGELQMAEPMNREVVNVEQAAAWNGDEGEHWTAHADRYDAATARTWQRFLDAGLVHADDDLIDIGCGTGRSTIDCARIARGALGVDISGVMLDLARQRARAAGVTNIEFAQGDAQVHPFTPTSVDLVISRFGAMFFADPVAAFTNIGGALRPGGRLALLAWRELADNEWLTVVRTALAAGRDLPLPPPDAPTPFRFADPDRVRRILEPAGFTGIDLTPIDEPIVAGVDADDATEWFAGTGVASGLLEPLDAPAREAALAKLHDAYAAAQTPDGVLLRTAAWLITATRA